MWLWISFLLALHAEANSNGVGLPCNVNPPNLGSTQRTTKNPDRIMWWVMPPVFAGNQYTLRTADTSTPGTDPTTYTPNEWTTIYVRTTFQDQQFTGLVLYATNAQDVKVGEWQVPANAPFHVSETDNCVVHSNADPKNYLSVFKFKGPPASSGPITIKALVKFGLAFPNPTGTFFWPNNAHLVLTEKAPTAAQTWFEGAVGESCIDVCTKRGLGCDLATMKAQGNSVAFLSKVAAFSNCSGPLMPGCSAASPNVGRAGCFYHSDTCEQPAFQAPWVRSDICAGLREWVEDSNYYWGQNGNPSCCKYNNSKWCIRYTTNSRPSYDQYGPWGYAGGGFKGDCMPVGGYPAAVGTIPVPARVNPGPTAITCEAKKDSVMDGHRICACSSNGQFTSAPTSPTIKGTPTRAPSRPDDAPSSAPGGAGIPVADSASTASLSFVALFVSFVALF